MATISDPTRPRIPLSRRAHDQVVLVIERALVDLDDAGELVQVWSTDPLAESHVYHRAAAEAAAEALENSYDLRPAPAVPPELRCHVEAALAETIERPPACQALRKYHACALVPLAWLDLRSAVVCELTLVGDELRRCADLDPQWYGASLAILAGAAVAAFWRVAAAVPATVEAPGRWHCQLVGAAMAEVAFPLVFTGEVPG